MSPRSQRAAGVSAPTGSNGSIATSIVRREAMRHGFLVGLRFAHDESPESAWQQDELRRYLEKRQNGGVSPGFDLPPSSPG